MFTSWEPAEPNDFPLHEPLVADEMFLELQLEPPELRIPPAGGSWNDCCQGLIDARRYYYVVEWSTPAESFDHGYLNLSIPPGHLPPPGECKLWYPGLPPGQQPPPAKCADLKATARPGVVVIDHDGWIVRDRRGR